MVHVRVIGGGPAGSAAALSALQAGAAVTIYEKSQFPRHKVCGEFLSPRTALLFERLGVSSAFQAARPARINRLMLCFGEKERHALLPETAYGMSRYAMDQLLLREAISKGAQLVQEAASPSTEGLSVIATGRKASEAKGRRLFGFKAHFEGPTNDAIELYFQHGRSYVGTSAVEDGITNVCGLAEESVLAPLGFQIDEYLDQFPPLRNRLKPMRRKGKWITVGPLVYKNRFSEPNTGHDYYAGDSLSFIDPFTGSGMLSAMLSGHLAGSAAASKIPVDRFLQQAKQALQQPFQFASILRYALESGWGMSVAPYIPSSFLLRFTRPLVL